MVPVLEAFADAIMEFEGWKPGSVSYRNRNPGNLRSEWDYQPHDSRHYRIFPSMVDGYRELVSDLRSKFSGDNTHELSGDSTVQDVFKVYAPSSDANDPIAYAAFVASFVGKVYRMEHITGLTRIASIYQLAGQECPSVKRSP